MKRNFRQICSAVVSLNLIASAALGSMPVLAVSDAQADDGFRPAKINLKPVISSEKDETPEVRNTPLFEGMDTPEAEKLAEESSIPVLPVSFDLRDENKVTPVADQNPYGTCWSFGAIASAESDLIGLYPDIDLSELHTAYFPYSGNGFIDGAALEEQSWLDILDLGGNLYLPINAWSQWAGPVFEETLPYDNAYLTDTPEELEQYRYMADFHMENAHIFGYADRFDYENREAVNEVIKGILHGGNVVNATYAHMSDDFGGIYNGPDGTDTANHSIAIVGWDDTYSKDNFTGMYTPEHDGAWLIKNSWGTEAPAHDNGYTWISYDELSLGEFVYFDMESAEKYDYNNYYDSLGFGASFTADEETGTNYEACVFHSEGSEYLKAVSTFNAAPYTDYEITVYTNLTDESDPTSGTAYSAGTGTLEESGYFTIELDSPILIDEAQSYSVVIKLNNEDYPYVIPAEAYINSEFDGEEIDLGFNLYDYETLFSNTEEYVSFFSADGTEWTDTALYTYDFTETEENEFIESVYEILTPEDIEFFYGVDLYEGDYSLTLGNINLKALTTNCDRVSFSHDKAVPLNETVTLTADNGADIYYSINGGEDTLYTEPFAVTEEITVSAYTSGSGVVTERTLYPAETALTDFAYGVVLGEDVTAVKKDYHVYTTDEGYKAYFIETNAADMNSIIPMFSTPSEEILINGEAFTEGDTLDLELGENLLEVTLGATDTLAGGTIFLDVYVSALVWNYVDEMLISDENTVVTLDDGTELEHFVPYSASDYAGQQVTAIVYDEAGNAVYSEISNVPPRNYMPELSIDYYAEEITGFSEADIETLMISENDGEFEPVYYSDYLVIWGNITIEPGTKYSFKLPAVEGEYFESEIAVVETPERPAGPEKLYYEINIADNTITFGNPEENVEYGSRLHYEPIETYEQLIAKYEKEITEEELAESGCETVEEYLQFIMDMFGYTTEEFIEAENMFNEIFSPMEIYEDGVTGSLCYEDEYGNLPDEVDMDFGVRFMATDNAFASEYTYERVTANPLTDNSLGDVDRDGFVDASDASYILAMYADMSTGKEVDTGSIAYAAANVDKSLTVDASDASYVLSYYSFIATGGSEDITNIVDYILFK